MTDDPPPPFMAEVPVPRVRDGEPSTEKLWVCFYAAWGPAPATLTISQDWDGSQHRTYRAYTVRGYLWAGDVCAVTLERSPADLEDLAPGADRQTEYGVYVGRSIGCTCRGFMLGAEVPRTCKHIAALAAVAAAGLLSKGDADATATSRGAGTDGG